MVSRLIAIVVFARAVAFLSRRSCEGEAGLPFDGLEAAFFFGSGVPDPEIIAADPEIGPVASELPLGTVGGARGAPRAGAVTKELT